MRNQKQRRRALQELRARQNRIGAKRNTGGAVTALWCMAATEVGSLWWSLTLMKWASCTSSTFNILKMRMTYDGLMTCLLVSFSYSWVPLSVKAERSSQQASITEHKSARPCGHPGTSQRNHTGWRWRSPGVQTRGKNEAAEAPLHVKRCFKA